MKLTAPRGVVLHRCCRPGDLKLRRRPRPSPEEITTSWRPAGGIRDAARTFVKLTVTETARLFPSCCPGYHRKSSQPAGPRSMCICCTIWPKTCQVCHRTCHRICLACACHVTTRSRHKWLPRWCRLGDCMDTPCTVQTYSLPDLALSRSPPEAAIAGWCLTGGIRDVE